jgi:hypothetical protein
MIIQVACATFAIYYLLRFPFCILSQIYAQALVTVSRLTFIDECKWSHYFSFIHDILSLVSSDSFLRAKYIKYFHTAVIF